ncbi:MAG: Asp23/Gls24 family envelope stress response protein [Oscillospiraceae bacterium]
MIKFYTPLGKISLTNDYFAGLVGNAIISCYGVAGMSFAGPADNVKTLLFGSDIPEKGVVVSEDNGELIIDLHIKVIFGVNIATIVENITEKVRYAVEQATSLKVRSINVSVDDIISE